MRSFCALAACLWLSVSAAGRQEGVAPGGSPADIDRAFAEFWDASDRAQAERRAEVVVRSGVGFEEAVSRIRQGREYSPNVPRGVRLGRHRVFNGQDHGYAFVVPADYDPTRTYPVRVHLHGGTGRFRPLAANRISVDRLPTAADEIGVFPTAWMQSYWWTATQVDNLSRILDTLKRKYNVDENRVYLTGTSDGGTGAYFMSLKDTTPWAGFLPLLGDVTVLASPQVHADGELFPGNAVNKPFFIVNAGRDRLYPAQMVRIHVEHLQRIGTPLVFHVFPESEHNTDWWPEARGAYEDFLYENVREPLPDRLSWEAERVDRYNRAHWLVIDRLGPVAGETDLPDSNLLARGRVYDFGLRLHPTRDRGRRVSETLPDSNARRLGLRVDDRVVAVNGREIRVSADIAEAIQRAEIGGQVRFSVDRDGRRVVLEGEFAPGEREEAPVPIFPRRQRSGRVDLLRRGNIIDASTEGVSAFTLLLSPSVFDFRAPVTVVANGRTVFSEVVEPSVETLLKWAARDNDRAMVFGAELHIDLTK